MLLKGSGHLLDRLLMVHSQGKLLRYARQTLLKGNTFPLSTMPILILSLLL